METQLVKAPVALTAEAIIEINILQSKEENLNKILRFGVKGGGCSGMTYVLGFDEKQPTDIVFEIAGITCIIDPAHELYLHGMVVDWQNGLQNRGFTFNNPNASSTCGCGTSFAV